MKLLAFLGVILIIVSNAWFRSFADNNVNGPREDTLHEAKRYVKVVFKKARRYNRQAEGLQKDYLKRIGSKERRIKEKLQKTDQRLADYLFTRSILNSSFMNKNEWILNEKVKTESMHGKGIGAKSESKESQGISLGYLVNSRIRIERLKDGLAEDKLIQSNESKKIKWDKILNKAEAELIRAEKNLQRQKEINNYTRKRKILFENSLRQKPELKEELTAFKKDAYYSKAKLDGAYQHFKTSLTIEKNLERIFCNVNVKAEIVVEKNNATIPLVNNATTGLLTKGMMMQTIKETSQLIKQSIERASRETVMSNLQRSTEMISEKLSQVKKEAGFAESLADMPDFKVNTIKTKRFVERVRYGITFQIIPGTPKVPIYGEAGISAGYMLTMKLAAGVSTYYSAALAESNSAMKYNCNRLSYGGYTEYQIKGMLHGMFNIENKIYKCIDSGNEATTASQWKKALMAGIKLKKSTDAKKRAVSMTIYYDFLNNKMPYTQPFVYRAGWEF